MKVLINMTNYTFAAGNKSFYPGMKKLLFFLCLFLHVNMLSAQKLKKADRVTVDNLKKNISYLSADKQEAGGVGTQGAQHAAGFIAESFKSIGLLPKGDKGSYLQEFEIQDGKQINKKTMFIVNDREMTVGKDYFPLAFSPNASISETAVATSLAEKGVPWFMDIDPALEEHKGDTRFNVYEFIKNEAKKAYDKGATALVIYNTGDNKDNITFNKKDTSPAAALPVFYLTKAGRQGYLKDASATYDVRLAADIGASVLKEKNVIGYINNNAPSTIVIGAHYYHPGHNENSGQGSKQVYRGTGNNASGTAAVIELARLLKKSRARKNNYLLVAFSGAGSGWEGSEYFAAYPTVDLSAVNYMINMDMIGSMDDNEKVLNIAGAGTSPEWNEIIYARKNIPFTIKADSIGTKPGDYLSFYQKKIPVLFFSTGYHSDDHKPADDADKINYAGELYIIKYIGDLIEGLNKKGKLAFTPAKEITTAIK
jgi:hypothetical protein